MEKMIDVKKLRKELERVGGNGKSSWKSLRDVPRFGTQRNFINLGVLNYKKGGKN